MFALQQIQLITEFKTTLCELKNILLNQTSKINELTAEVEYIRKQINDHGKKFGACAEGFRQTKIVCEELTERICEASGVISNINLY